MKSPLFEYRNMICSILAEWYRSNISTECYNPLVQQIPHSTCKLILGLLKLKNKVLLIMISAVETLKRSIKCCFALILEKPFLCREDRNSAFPKKHTKTTRQISVSHYFNAVFSYLNSMWFLH